MKPHFIPFYDHRTKARVFLNPAYVCSVREAKSAWGQTQIEFIGNSGYHTDSIYVSEPSHQVVTQLAASTHP